MQIGLYIIIGVIGYLLGSIPFSYLLPKWINKVDIRMHGSGNAGTTNVFRNLGLKASIIAFIGDFLKGVVPTFIGYYLLGYEGAIVGGTFSILGHCYPFTLGFKGGKGVATAAGVIFVFSPLALGILLIVQFGILFTTRLMSLASLASCVGFPICFYFLGFPPNVVIFSAFVGAFVAYKHKANIIRLLKGEEKKLDLKSKGSLNKKDNQKK